MSHTPFPKYGGLTESEFQDLATYNGEIHRGIVHTDEWVRRMYDLQTKFEAAAHQWNRDNGFIEI